MTIFSAITSKIFGAVSLAMLILLATTTIDRNQWRAAARKADTTIAKFTVAQEAAKKAAQAAHDAQEQRYKDLANAADTHHRDTATVASDATTAFADTHRVRDQAARCPSSAAIASAPRVDPGVPTSLPSSTYVVISNADLHACTDAYVYALGAHDWALGLNPMPAAHLLQ